MSSELSDDEVVAVNDFVSRVNDVPLVNFVVVTANPTLHVYTGLKRRILRSCQRIYQIEDYIQREHSSVSLDFHIIYSSSRPWTDFVGVFDWVVYHVEFDDPQDQESDIRKPLTRSEQLAKPIVPPKWP
jgi:hypothetical protein